MVDVYISKLGDQTFGPYPMRVCHEKIGEFLHATDGPIDRWMGAAPPAYLASALFVVAPALLAKLDGFSVIHGEQTFEWSSAFKVEQDLLVSGTVTRVRERGGSYFVSFEISVTDGGSEIAAGSSLFLVGQSLPAQAEPATTPSHGVDDRGDPGPGQKSASRSDLIRYAAATRDWNPIHWDHQSAAAAGLPSVVVHGLLQTAWALDAATTGVPGVRPLTSAKIRFRSPLLTAHPVDVRVESVDDRRTVTISDENTQFLTAQVELAEA